MLKDSTLEINRTVNLQNIVSDLPPMLMVGSVVHGVCSLPSCLMTASNLMLCTATDSDGGLRSREPGRAGESEAEGTWLSSLSASVRQCLTYFSPSSHR